MKTLELDLKYLELWKYPESYFGDTYYDYYPVIGKHRDSKILDLSNYECIEKHCIELVGKDNITYESANHWAVGWVETLMIHKDCKPGAIQEIDDIIGSLAEEYPVFNESHYSELMYNDITEYWNNMSLSDKVDECKRSGISIFQARDESIPNEIYQNIESEF